MLYLVFECSIYIIKAESDSLLGTACIWRQMCVKLSSFYICGHYRCSEQRPLCSILRHVILKRHKDRREPLRQRGSLKEKVNSTNFVRHQHIIEGMIQSGTDQKTTQDIHFLWWLVVMLSVVSLFNLGHPNVRRLRFVLIILSSISLFIFYLGSRPFVYFCFGGLL